MRKLLYNSQYISFITTVTKHRRPLFLASELAERLGIMIHMACRSKGFVPLAYAILPDHVHLMVCAPTLIERALESTRSTIGKASVHDKKLTLAEGGLSSSPSTRGDFSTHDKIQSLVEGGLSSPPDPTISDLMRSIKGTFSRTLDRGSVWQPGYFCWYLEQAHDVIRTTDYIIHNYQHSNVTDKFGHEPYVWVDRSYLDLLLS